MRQIKRLLLIGVFLFCQNGFSGEIDVMTQNQYLGADLTPIILAAASGDLEDLNNAIITALKQIAANNTPERIQAQTALISKRKPHIVGLQETFSFSCVDPYMTGACNDPDVTGAFNDFLELTLVALDGSYSEVATVVNLNTTVPFDLYGSGMPAFLTVIDRDVIMKRDDIDDGDVAVVNFGCDADHVSVDGCNYLASVPPIFTPFGEIDILRGYVGIDATLGDQEIRIVNTHLEVKDASIPPIIQAAQAQELITVLAATTPTDSELIVLGDINSSPEEPLPSPYAQFNAAGYTDIWTLRPGRLKGYTCCQPENLTNQKSDLGERIDMVFSRGQPLQAKKIRVLGDKVSSKTHPPGKGLWPSDHGAIATGLYFY